MTTERLKIAVQKSGRLSELSLRLLEKCGIGLEKSKDQLLCKARNFPLDVFLVRDDDIPAFVATDVCQIGIVGQNVLLEKQASSRGPFKTLESVLELGFGKCRLSLALPNELNYEGVSFFDGKTIATSYQGLLSQYLEQQGIKAKIVTMQGAIEIAPKTHLADAICDLVSTGNTLVSNGLKEVETLLQSQAILVRNKGRLDPLIEIYEQLLIRMKAVLRAQNSRYVMLNCPLEALEQIKSILPGSDSPTVIPLQGCDDKVSVHAVCEEEIFWNTMETLKTVGASAILVLPIEKMLD